MILVLSLSLLLLLLLFLLLFGGAQRHERADLEPDPGLGEDAREAVRHARPPAED